MSDYPVTFTDALRALGERARRLRLGRELRQETLAARAGVSVATVRRFEKTGAASLETVLRIANALGVDQAFASLFELPAFATLDEALARPRPARQRAPRR